MSLRFLTAGESHGPALTAILDGLPAGLPVTPELIAADLGRRQRGAGSGGRMAIEQDQAQILGGVMEGRTTGAPVSLLITNKDHAHWLGKAIPPFTIPRPGHADLPAAIKYGYDDLRLALERASARETAARVAVGALCRAYLKTFGIEVGGWVAAIGGVTADTKRLLLDKCVEAARASDVSCPDPDAVAQMRAAINHAAEQGETLGGVVEVIATGVPVGLGSHVQWDRKLTTRLAAALMGIPATKGVEIGEAFANAALAGSQVQDAIRVADDRLVRTTNRCGGIEGGISNGQPIVVRIAIKPIPTTRKSQSSVDLVGGAEVGTKYERSDVCPVPRAVPVVEAMVAFVLADALLEKLGGDSIAEQEPRFAQLRKAELTGLSLTGQPHVFWS
ncbi:MAG: chorismate synthase [Kiritimatiellia bacterium]